MARCPKCKHHFRVLEDEEGMHDCPHCGYGGKRCIWCGHELDDNEFDPYCSVVCAIRAEADSEED